MRRESEKTSRRRLQSQVSWSGREEHERCFRQGAQLGQRCGAENVQGEGMTSSRASPLPSVRLFGSYPLAAYGSFPRWHRGSHWRPPGGSHGLRVTQAPPCCLGWSSNIPVGRQGLGLPLGVIRCVWGSRHQLVRPDVTACPQEPGTCNSSKEGTEQFQSRPVER